MLIPLLLIALAVPPDASLAPVTEILHGETFVDENRWLEGLESESPAVRDWTSLQLERTRAALDVLPCRDRIADTLEPLMKLPSIGTPVMAGPFLFYSERSGNQNQPVLKLQKGTEASSRSTARTLFDPNAMDVKGLLSLDWWTPTLDGTLLAFGTSKSGSEMSELRVLDTQSGAMKPDVITGKVNFEGWTPSKDGFLYSALRNPKDPYSREIRFHILGSDPATDRLLMKQTNPTEIPFGGMSRDGRWLILGLSRGWQANDLSVGDFQAWRAGTSDPVMTPIATGLPARFSPIGFDGSHMYLYTTFQASNARLVRVDLHNPAQANWKDLIPERRDEVLESVELVKGGMIGSYTRHVCSRLERFDRDGQSQGDIPLPGLGTAGLSTDEDHSDAFLSYTSYDSPRSIMYIASLPEPKPVSWWEPKVPVDLTQLTVEQVRVASKDGTMVPIFMVRRKDLKPHGDNPCVLYGYGGFNASMSPSFNPTIIPWVEAGGIYAVANLRGGGEYGEAWHEAGMLDRKQNVFDDFYACAEWLIANKWTQSSQLAVMGGSNGGLLTGVAITQRPELFAAAICGVPLLDMLRYQQFLLAKYWVPEYGSSEKPEQFQWLRAYSPYHNIKKNTKYPAVLLTAGENDSRVHPLHARKMTARLQATNASDPNANPVLLWVDRDSGHGQGKPLALRIRDQVDQWSFLMWRTGLCNRFAQGSTSESAPAR